MGNNFHFNQNCGERFGGGFLLPFLTGAAISAPFWYLGGVNKGQQMYYPQPYPVFYPYYPNDYQGYYPYYQNNSYR